MALVATARDAAGNPIAFLPKCGSQYCRLPQCVDNGRWVRA